MTGKPSRIRPAIIWYLIGGSAVGFTTGWLAGLSRSPVMVTLIPLVLSVVGTSSGLLIATGRMQSSLTYLRLFFVGIFATTFTTNLLIGSIVGLSVRTGAPVVDVVFPTFLSVSPDDATLGDHTDHAARILSARAKLIRIGASATERQAFLALLSKEYLAEEGFSSSALARIHRRCQNIGNLTTLLTPTIAKAASNNALPEVNQVLVWLGRLESGRIAIEYLSEVEPHQVAIVFESISDQIDAMSSTLTDLGDETDDAGPDLELASDEEVMRAVAALNTELTLLSIDVSLIGAESKADAVMNQLDSTLESVKQLPPLDVMKSARPIEFAEEKIGLGKETKEFQG